MAAFSVTADLTSMTWMEHAEATSIGPEGITFRLPDPEHRYAWVRVDMGLGGAAPRPELAWTSGLWQAQVPMPDATRLEYTMEAGLRIVDPGNPLVVDGGGGVRSVLELPGYRTPAWLGIHAADHREHVEFRTLLGTVEGIAWEAPGAHDAAPLVVINDGPAYAEEGRILDYLTYLATRRGDAGRALGVRVLLLSSPDRESWYSANEEYAAALAEVVGAARRVWPTTVALGMGASLGALAALHAQWRRGVFDGLFLQSGSFFTEATDPQERGFARYDSIVDFVAEVGAGLPRTPLPPVAMTCGAHEENAQNNRLLADRLGQLRRVSYLETRQGHNFVAWRDALDPSLADLLETVMSGHGSGIRLG